MADGEAGLPFIRNFSPTEYGGAPQNWSVIQDQQGVIYVGNVGDGLFAFDGSRWRRIPIPNRSAVRSLAMDAAGRIYVGAVGDFGYLAPNAFGQMHFVSLLDKLPVGQRQFTDVWKTLATRNGVYFTTRTTIFRVANGVVKTWNAQTAFHMAFAVGDTVYVRQFERGLMRVNEGDLVLVAGGERFADEKIYVLLPWKGADARPGELLIGTRSDGWWLFDGQHYRRWSAAADTATRNLALYDGIWLSNGRLALAAPPGGLLVLDQSGHVVQHLTRANGMANNAVNGLFEDRQGGVWVTSDIGVSRISIERPISMFDERNGLTGAVIALKRYQGKLYAGTTDGLFELAGAGSGNTRFTRVSNMKGGAWALLDSGRGLLVGATEGIYILKDGRVALIRSTDPLPVSMLRSRLNPDRIYLGCQEGLASLHWDGRRWVDEGVIGEFNDEIRSMVEDGHGRLWLGAWNSIVLRVTPPRVDRTTGVAQPASVERFDTRQGLPPGPVSVVRIDGELRIGSSGGILYFDPGTERLVADPRFASVLETGGTEMTLVEQDAQGKLWMTRDDVGHGLRGVGSAVADENGNWHWTPTPLQPLAGLNMMSILPESDGTVWFSAEQGLFRLSPTSVGTGAAQIKFSTLLHAISAKDGARKPLAADANAAVPIPYQKNELRFEFAAPSFDGLDANRFQTQLEGLDADWSPWSSEAYRDYTNMPNGEYRFLVRSRNMYGHIGESASFEFHILSPWYRTWWAWTLWSVLGAASLALIIFWRSTALRKRNRTLVALVESRTAELQTAINALSEQNTTDPLTGLKNRRYLHERMAQNVALAERVSTNSQDRPGATDDNMVLAFLMMDIDHFKEVNDTHGHAAGDLVLQQIRDILLTAARDSDTPIRWGGEEFLILAHHTKPGSGALLAERLCALVAAHPFDLGNGLVVHRTCSIGFASYPFFDTAPAALSWEQVVNMADECMYAAKQRGRNGWVGVQADKVVPQDVSAALRESLQRAPEPGPLDVLLPQAPLDFDSRSSGSPAARSAHVASHAAPMEVFGPRA